MQASTEHQASAKLFKRLGHELFQTETSAALHCRREAERLGAAPPAEALRAVANHAQDVLRDLPGLAALTSVPQSKAGATVGRIFSELRDKLADRMIDSERSYRGTLLGARHGVDLVRLLRSAAEQQGDRELQAFCDRWLERRGQLVERVAAELDWFARNPENATALSGTQRARRGQEGDRGKWQGL
jgi:hypothetical protein